jgi:DNA-directed RNA polymerase delta subunit
MTEKQKKILGWEVNDLDRVRMEYKAMREKLKKKGIYTLSDLIENPRFMNFNEDRWKLRQFKRTKQLPRMWQDYSEQDKYSFAGTFQLEHIRAKDKVDNVAQYRKNIPEISFFEKKLDKVMLLFDDMWDGRAHTL